MSSDESQNSSLHAESDSNIKSVGRSSSVTSSDDSDSMYVNISIESSSTEPNYLNISWPHVEFDGSADSFEHLEISEAFNSSDSQLASATSPMTCGDVRLSLALVKLEGGADSSLENEIPSDAIDASKIEDVIIALRDKHYDIQINVDGVIEGKCSLYFKKDYYCEVINQEACRNYPSRLIVPVAVKENGVQKEGSKMNFDREIYAESVSNAAHARIRGRFPAPVILFDNKYISRAGTLSCWKTAAYNQAIQLQTPDIRSISSTFWSAVEAGNFVLELFALILDGDYMRKLFKKDEFILQHLNVKNIVDLMVEYRKCYKELIVVSSSEVMNMDVYRSMKIQDLPFPGCEFFTKYNDANRRPEGLKFDWSAAEVERELQLIEGLENCIPDIDRMEMKEWDLVQLTKNYLKILLSILVKDTHGILIHCISGWDRTPLFVSLLRLSLWADGVIHPSLNHEEMAYLTVGYDWYLFGHAFRNRWNKREEIMHFCFNFLPHIATDEFSITKMFERLPADEKKSRKFPDYKPGREEALNELSQHVLDAYNKHIIEHFKCV